MLIFICPSTWLYCCCTGVIVMLNVYIYMSLNIVVLVLYECNRDVECLYLYVPQHSCCTAVILMLNFHIYVPQHSCIVVVRV